MEKQSSIDVLICGAGAAGLTLALDLARRGIPFRIVEQRECPFAGSRGKGIQPRTQEVFEDLGILDRVVAAGGLYPPLREYRQDGSYVEKTMFDARAPSRDVPYFIPLMIPQHRTEAIMREALAQFGHRVEFGCALVGFEECANGVSLRLSTGRSEERVEARYVVGADGGRSFVRGTLGVAFPGETLGVRAIVADVRLSGLDRDAWHQFNDGDRHRLVAICPLGGTDLFQIQTPIPLEGTPDLSAGGLQQMIAERTGQGHIEIQAVAWASAYAMNARLADRFRVGRIFLIGDAAHIHPPTGGQGLNTSVQDAYNLGWKLAAVLGGAPDGLLDTYQEERRPVAEDVLGLSTRLLADQGKQDRMRRGRDTNQLGIGYRDSSLSHDATARESGPLAGDRMPDAVLAGAAGQQRRLFDLMSGPQWTLLISCRSYQPPIAQHEDVRVVTVGANGELRDPDDQLGMVTGEARLIRPDGYVGASFDGSTFSKLGDYLAMVLPPSRLASRSFSQALGAWHAACSS